MSKKSQAIELLESMAKLHALDGANSFRVNAHSNAARALEKFEGDFDAMAASGKLTEIHGIGKGIAEKLQQLVESGEVKEYEELKAKYPDGVIQMLEISGFGPKKAAVVYHDLGIETLEDLRTACEDGRVAKLKGFGKKTAEKIIHGIEQFARFAGRHRLDKALRLAGEIADYLKQLDAVERLEMCGSARRCKETVGDLDFVVATADSEAVMAAFREFPDVKEIIGSGSTKTSVRLSGGVQADLRTVSAEQFPYAILHFTGSKEHNTRLRQLAKERGLKLNEYGLFPEAQDRSLAAESEEQIYQHLDLPFIIPEMREDMGEIEAGQKNELPEPLNEKDLRGLLHMHTYASDGKPTAADYAQWALDNGIEWMGIADHSQSLTVANGLTEERVLEQHREIEDVNAQYADKGVRILKGIESDILKDGSLDYPEEFLPHFDFIVASVHNYFELSEYEQTERVLKALENPHTTILGHMTGRLLLQRDGFKIDQMAVIRRAAELGVAIEINANPRRLDLDWRMVRRAVDEGCQLTIGPDAHVMAGLDDTWFGVRMARKGWAQTQQILNCLGADEFLAFAKARKEK